MIFLELVPVPLSAGVVAEVPLFGVHAMPDDGAGRNPGVVGVWPCAAANMVMATINAIHTAIVAGRILKQPIISLSKKVIYTTRLVA